MAAAAMLADVPMVERTERVLLLGVLVLRVAQYVPPALVILGGDATGYTRPRLVAGVFAAAAVWTGLVLATGFTRARIPRWMAVVDVALVAASALLVGRWCAGEAVVGWANWTVGPLHGAALLAVLCLPWRQVAVAVLALAAAYLAGIGMRVAESTEVARGAVGNTAVLLGFAAAAVLFATLSRRQAAAVDAAHAEALAAEQQRAATQARYEERTRQYRMLHDTVLQTLTAIARGGLDHHAEVVRARCRAEADYLRGLIDAAESDAMPVTIGVALAQAGRRAAGLGLRVHQQFDRLPDDLPPEVVAGLAGAVTEALNNVARHAGTRQAYLTAYADGDRITVTVTDQGDGFDPALAPAGGGIAESIQARVAAVGAATKVISKPGEGASVELTWPAS